MEVSQERSRVRSAKLLNCGVTSKVRAIIIGIFIQCAFYVIEVGMFTHKKMKPKFLTSKSNFQLPQKNNPGSLEVVAL